MRRDRVELAAAGFAFALGLVLLLTGSGGAYVAQVVVWVSINIILACSLRVMLLVGEVNLAVGGFFGVGAYVAAVAFLTLGLPMLVGIALGALVAGLFSLPFGYVTLRTSGHYFMLISFALTEVLRLIYTKSMLLGGNSGLVGMYPDIKGYPLLVLALAVAIFLGFYFLDRSHLGRVFSAVAQNEKVVRSVGIHVSRVKLLCLVISSCAAGFSGGLFSFANTVIAPGDFGFMLSIYALAYVKIGGQSHAAGSVVGTVLLFALAQLAIQYGAQDMLIYGAALLVAMLLMPEGVVGLAQKALGRLRLT
jgi:branched-chain amino acid transport system permease protein